MGRLRFRRGRGRRGGGVECWWWRYRIRRFSQRTHDLGNAEIISNRRIWSWLLDRIRNDRELTGRVFQRRLRSHLDRWWIRGRLGRCRMGRRRIGWRRRLRGWIYTTRRISLLDMETLGSWSRHEFRIALAEVLPRWPGSLRYFRKWMGIHVDDGWT